MSRFAERQNTGIRGRLYLEHLGIRRGNVVIRVENEDGEVWRVVFDHYIAIRVADEGFRLVSAPDLPSSGCRVLEARESEFIDWIQRESEGVAGNEQLIHTVVLTADDIVEVVAFEPAKILVGAE